MYVYFAVCRHHKSSEKEKQDYNRADSQDDSGPPLKRLRGGFTEPLVKSGGERLSTNIIEVFDLLC